MRVEFIAKWYDLWIGAYWDKKSKKLYLLPLPCVGFVVDFSNEVKKIESSKKWKRKIYKKPVLLARIKFTAWVFGYCTYCRKFWQYPKRRRLNTGYVEEEKNFEISCKSCYVDHCEDIDSWWESLY